MNKFCINCKYHQRTNRRRECHHPNSSHVVTNLVTGEKTITAMSCGTLRDGRNDGHGLCGSKGLWYVSKAKEDTND